MKIALFTLIILLTAYAPAELTRLIIIYEIILRQHPEIALWKFVGEIAWIWVGYIGALGIISYLLKRL